MPKMKVGAAPLYILQRGMLNLALNFALHIISISMKQQYRWGVKCAGTPVRNNLSCS